MQRLRWDEPRAYRRAQYSAERADLTSVTKGFATIFLGFLGIAAFARLNPDPNAHLPEWKTLVLVALAAGLTFGIVMPALVRHAAVALVIVGGAGINHNRMAVGAAQVRFWPWAAFTSYAIASETVGAETFRTLRLFENGTERLRVAIADSISEANLRAVLGPHLRADGPDRSPTAES